MLMFRPLLPAEAVGACEVIRRSIVELCRPDHDDLPSILQPWLANKTPETVRTWIERNPTGVIGGFYAGELAGVGAVLPGGRIVLNYVAPWARFRRVSQGLVREMERVAMERGDGICCLTSTITARGFYQALGYEEIGPSVVSFGGKPAFPMQRVLRPLANNRVVNDKR